MTIITQVLHSVLPDSKVHDVTRDIEVHALLSAFTASTVFMRWVGKLNSPSFGIETLIKFEANSLLPPIVKMVLSEGPKLNVALIGEIHELQLEVVPIVEGKHILIDLLIERQPI